MKTLLFNPFEKYSEKILLLFGIAFSLIGGFLGFAFNTRFDGVIDLHFVEKVSLYEPISDILIDILCTTVLLYIVGKYINKKTRIIDILSVSMIARIPFYLLTFFNADNLMYTISQRMLTFIKPEKISNISTTDLSIVFVFAMITILFLIWFIILLFNGFKIAVNAKDTKHILFFAGAMIVAEILSKVLISLLP